MLNMFIVVLGILCNSNFLFYLSTCRCFEGSAGSLPPVIFLSGYNIKPTSCMPCGSFCTLAMEHLKPWSRLCTGPTINITRWFHHQFLTRTSTYSYMEVCGMEHTPVHILRYMGQMSNNSKMLINNLSCCLAIRVVCTRITVT